MKYLHRLYFAFNRWRYGEIYGCGRCHHPVRKHTPLGCTKRGCPCHAYNNERLRGKATVTVTPDSAPGASVKRHTVPHCATCDCVPDDICTAAGEKHERL